MPANGHTLSQTRLAKVAWLWIPRYSHQEKSCTIHLVPCPTHIPPTSECRAQLGLCYHCQQSHKRQAAQHEADLGHGVQFICCLWGVSEEGSHTKQQGRDANHFLGVVSEQSLRTSTPAGLEGLQVTQEAGNDLTSSLYPHKR